MPKHQMLEARANSFLIIGYFRYQLTAILLNNSVYLLSLFKNIGLITKSQTRLAFSRTSVNTLLI